eukprot:gene1653-1840_t
MKQEECHTQLFKTFEDIAPSRATVFRWFAEFKRGREILKDDAHSGRPPTAVVPETVAAVEKMLREDGRMTYSMLQDSLKIGSAAVHTILHEKLQVRKVTACWVPHCLTDQQKDHRVDWCQFKLQKFDEGKSKRVLDDWRNNRPRTGLRCLLWHHDNGSAHTAALTIDFLSGNSIQLVTQPAYSPDLAPCDFFLFPTVKEKIRGTRFDSCDDAICPYKEAVSDLTKEQWAPCFDMWFYRMRLCIEAKGEYFEKL